MNLRKTARKRNSGSPSPGEPEYLLVGKLRRPHGVRGDLLMEVITDFPERLKPGTPVFVGTAHRRYVIGASRHHALGLLIRFEGIDSPEGAGLLRNQQVSVSGANRPALPAGHYYQHELLGLQVVDDAGMPLGQLAEILQTGANDVYVVRSDERAELLLPAIDSVILEIDVPARTIHVRVPAGLLPESGAESSRRSLDPKKRHSLRG